MNYLFKSSALPCVATVTPTIMLSTFCPPLPCLMLKSQRSGLLVFRASGAICPCDRDTNDDLDRNDTASCCHSCKWLLRVLVPLSITPLYPGGLIFLIRSQPRLQDVKMILLAVQNRRHVLTTYSIMSPLQNYIGSRNFRFCQLTIIEISQMETFT